MTAAHPDRHQQTTGVGGIALVQASPRARAWLFALVVVLPLALIGLVELTDGSDTGAEDALAWRAAAGVAGFCLVLWGALATLLRRHRLSLAGGMLEVATTFYTRRHALADLDLGRARVVSLGERPELRPMLRTNGFAIPGFRSGWYRLRNGDRALVATAGGDRVAWIPTAKGHALVLQPSDPQALLDRLRAMAAHGGSR
jgi:hypothetical protein